MSARGYTDRGIGALIKALKSPPVARVGILAGSAKNARRPAPGEKKVPTNAEVGAAHEFGAPKRKLKQRSWLRAPLIARMDKEIAKNPKLMRATFQKAARDGTLFKFLGQIGVIAEGIIRVGFTNDGYGKWKPLSPKYAARKTVKNILVETQQLREAVTSTVVKGK